MSFSNKNLSKPFDLNILNTIKTSSLEISKFESLKNQIDLIHLKSLTFGGGTFPTPFLYQNIYK